MYIYIYIPGGAGFLPSTVAPENGWLDDEFPFGKACFQVRTVSFEEGNTVDGNNPALENIVR